MVTSRSHRWHQSDLVITRRRSIPKVLSTRSYHCAYCDADHILVRSRVRLQPNKLQGTMKPGCPSINTTRTSDSERLKQESRDGIPTNLKLSSPASLPSLSPSTSFSVSAGRKAPSQKTTSQTVKTIEEFLSWVLSAVFARVLLTRLQALTEAYTPSSSAVCRLGDLPRTWFSLQVALSTTRSAVFFDGSTLDPFPIKSGVKQGPTLFGILFSPSCHIPLIPPLTVYVYLHTRTDGKLFNVARLRAKTKVKTVKMLRWNHTPKQQCRGLSTNSPVHVKTLAPHSASRKPMWVPGISVRPL